MSSIIATMEEVPKGDSVTKVAGMVGNFVSKFSYFEIEGGDSISRIIIFRDEDLEALPFDENGELSYEDMLELLPKAIIPLHN